MKNCSIMHGLPSCQPQHHPSNKPSSRGGMIDQNDVPWSHVVTKVTQLKLHSGRIWNPDHGNQ